MCDRTLLNKQRGNYHNCRYKTKNKTTLYIIENYFNSGKRGKTRSRSKD